MMRLRSFKYWIYKKTHALLLLNILFSSFCIAQDDVYLFSYFMGNGEDGLFLASSLDGLTWNTLNKKQAFLSPKIGESKLMRDPCILMGPDSVYHMVWTIGWEANGIGYAYSNDLMNWSEQKYIPVMEHEPDSRNCWAPELIYDDENDVFMIYWSTTIPGRFPETDKTGDNGYNHRIYFVTTKDFESFSKTKLLYEPGFNVIDATIFKHEERFYMFIKDETRHPPKKNIRLSASQNLYGPYSEPTEPLTGDYWAEGPTVLKTGEGWMVYFDKYRKNKMGAIFSKDLEQWKDISEYVKFPEGLRHGTTFKIPLYMFNKLPK